VGYYTFDGDLRDVSGFQRHAVSDPVGGALRFLSTRKVAPSQVLSLGGSNVSITIPSLAGFGPNGYRGTTVSLWMRCPIQGYLLGCARESVPEQSSFSIRTDGKRLMVSGGMGDEQGFEFPESPNDWRHVVVVFSRSTQTNEKRMVVQLWVDGRAVGVALGCLAGLIVAASVGRTIERNRDFASAVTLWKQNVRDRTAWCMTPERAKVEPEHGAEACCTNTTVETTSMALPESSEFRSH
jgi:hypothetical protein